MGVIGDVFQLTDVQEWQGQQCLNVYFYRQAVILVGNAAQQLAEAYINELMPGVQQIQDSNVVHTSIICKNLFNESEAYTELISEPGGLAQVSLPSFNAVAFRLSGNNSAVRDGQKRFAGVTETSQDEGVIVDATYLANLDILGAALLTFLSGGISPDAFIPVIVKRILDGGSYRLPANSGEAVLSDVIEYLFNVDVSSQTSRKVGRGA